MFQFFYIVIQCLGQICFNSFTVLWYSVVDRYISIPLQYCDTVSSKNWSISVHDTVSEYCKRIETYLSTTLLQYCKRTENISVHDIVSQYCKIIETYMTTKLYHSTVKEVEHIWPRHCITILFFYSILIQCRGQIYFNSLIVLW
jgi:hypothetical protein